MQHVPYRGTAPALTDLLGGQTQVYFAALSASIEHVRAGKLRALAVTTAKRLPLLPEIPAVSEFVAGYESISFNGIVAPRNTPADVVDKLNKEINAGLADSKIIAKISDLGGTVASDSPADFGKFLATQVEKWTKVVKFADIKPE